MNIVPFGGMQIFRKGAMIEEKNCRHEIGSRKPRIKALIL
jgi:hypothetical protein